MRRLHPEEIAELESQIERAEENEQTSVTVDLDVVKELLERFLQVIENQRARESEELNHV